MASGEQLRAGLEVADIRTGQSSTVFGGVSVGQVTADGTSIGLQVLLGGDPALVTYARTST
ncbi:hypothetical protein ABZ863_29895 [Saccharomonospora sp. NPDC046836]|uniref:hypothetical protein n=1 Tax=Saccharomonospora sp. NPDC046836 TaxID=3156921 RepID=UPI003405A240